MSWETSSMTSLGRKGNTKIAGQLISQLWALNPRPDQGSQYVFNVSDSPTNFSVSLSLSLPPFSFSFIILLYLQPSLLTFLLFLPDSVVVEARSHALLLAVSSVRSCCRCRGLYAVLGKRQRGRRGGKGVGMDGWTDRWMLDRIGE